MQASAKQQLIQSFFAAFEQRIKRLPELCKSFPDEAFTLCLVYIDRLASGHFDGGPGQNRSNFSRALKQLSGNALFGMIHPFQVKELTQPYGASATSFIKSVTGRQPNALFGGDELVTEIRKSSLLDVEKDKLIENLWRASIANIAYDYIRVAEVHGPGSGGLSFDEIWYQGHTGIALDFETFYRALGQIFERIKEVSVTTGHWFGNPNYVKGRE